MGIGSFPQSTERTRGIVALAPYIAAAALLAISGRQALEGRATAREIFAISGVSLVTVLLIAARVVLVSLRESSFEREIEELNRRIDGLLTQVDRDALTGLLNHRAIHERLDRQITIGRLRNEPVAVAMLDLDNFKSVNDTLGHQTGDQVLRVIATLLTSVCRETDAVGRYAGDEFMIVLPALTMEDAAVLGARIAGRLKEVERELALGHDIRLSLSIGIAVTQTCRRSLAQTVAIADAAMYEAKGAGKDRVVVVNADTMTATESPAMQPPADELIASLPMRTGDWEFDQDRRAMYAGDRHSSTPRAAQA